MGKSRAGAKSEMKISICMGLLINNSGYRRGKKMAIRNTEKTLQNYKYSRCNKQNRQHTSVFVGDKRLREKRGKKS